VTRLYCVLSFSLDFREDPMGFIGVDRNTNTAVANTHILISMFVQALPYYAAM